MSKGPVHFSNNLSRRRVGFFCVLPVVCVLAIVALWPLLRVFYLSFTNQELFSVSSGAFVGLQNFYKICKDELFMKAVTNTVVFVAISVLLETVFGVFFACLMHYKHPLRGFMRAVVLIPWGIPTMISTKIWEWMLSDVGGVINSISMNMGLIEKPLLLSAHPTWALFVVAVIDVWKTTPFVALLILAGFQIIPEECADAARIDGVSPLRFFFRVTLPMLRNTIITAIVLRVIEAMRVFDVVYGLAGDNPSTLSLSVYIRQQMFSFQSVGMSSASAIILLLFVGSIIFLLLKMRSKNHS